MFYYFYETSGSLCLVQLHGSKEVYVTQMEDYYRKQSGQKHLIPFLKDWGTDDFEDHKENIIKVLGCIEVSEPAMSSKDKEVLNRCVSKEGFDYAMFHYSDYSGEVEFNKVEDKVFHEKRSKLLEAYEDLEMYLKQNGIKGM